MSLADDSKNRVLAMGRIGQVMSHQSQEETSDVIVYLKNGVKLHPDPPGWMTVLLQDLEIRQISMVITADAILKSLGDADEIHSLNRRLELTFSIKPTDNQDSINEFSIVT